MSMANAVASALNPAGPVAQVISELAWVLIVGAALLFCIVMALLAWALLRRREPVAAAANAATTTAAASPLSVPADLDRRLARRWIVGGGLIFPAAVLTALLVYATVQTLRLTPQRAADEPVITVIGKMWWWEVQYRDPVGPAGAVNLVLANEIHLPAGRAVTLGLVSADVIHSFWVPALAGKVDMVPGRVHQLRLQADRPGVYRGQCAEFCGEQHARMALHVVVHTPPAFAQWLAAQALPATPPTDAQALRGQQVYVEQRCAACHHVRGLLPGAGIGPDLTHIGSRLHLGAGTLPMGRDALVEWVAHSQRHKPGVRMPAYADRLDEPGLQALAAFLLHLQ